MKNIKQLLYIAPIAILAVGCAGGDNPGIEYAPDMYDAKSYEPYNQLDSNRINEYGANVRKPVPGTVAVGKADYSYQLPNTAEGFERSATEVLKPAGLGDPNCEGKRLYGIYCSPCHGAEGKNDGNVFKRASYLKPGAWGDGYKNEYIRGLADGQIYHTLVYGKNNMGSHASVLNPTQRWQVIAYVRQLSDGNTTCAKSDDDQSNTSSNNGNTRINYADTIIQDNFEVIEVDQEEMSKIKDDLSHLQFETGSAQLKEISKAYLDDIAELLHANDGLRVLIDGHTDNSGDRVKNMILSKQRAEAVKSYLISKGYAANRFITNGYGDRKPVDNSGTDLAKAKNRRVTFTFIK